MTSSLVSHQTFGPTSANGAMLQIARKPLLIGVMLAGLGTSAAYRVINDISPRPVHLAEQTSTGATAVAAKLAAPSLAELRRLSGFTWDQLARLFDVSPRSLHFWASGKPMTPSNEEHLQRLLAVVRRVDQGSASANRAALLAVRNDGTIPFDLLATGHYETVLSLLGSGQRVPRVTVPRLSDEAKSLRTPRPPEELVGAIPGTIHRGTGIARAAKSVKVRSGRNT